METKAKTKSILTKMLVALIIVATLIAGIFMAMPKTTEVHAAEAGSSATLFGDANNYNGTWKSKLASPVESENIASLLVTTNPSAIQGFTQGVDDGGSAINIAQDGSTPIYYYYKATGVQVDTDKDGATDSDSYDVVIYSDVETIYAPADSSSLFSSSNCKSIIFENFNTSQAIDMESMFYDCSSLTSLDLGGAFNTGLVKNMHWMFYECSSLTTLDLGDNFDTSEVTNMEEMFMFCSSLTTLDLGNNFDTSNVTDMSQMFLSCPLKKLDLSSFSFASITDASGVERMLGVSHAFVAQQFGLDVDTYVNATYDEKITILMAKGADEENARAWVDLCSCISTIIAPANLNGLSIALPSEYEYEDANGEKQLTSVLVAGATHTLRANIIASNWQSKLLSPVTSDNIESLVVTTDASKISGYTKGANVSTDEKGEIYYYYKATSNGGYDVVIYGDYDTIYAPENSSGLFKNLTNCKTITIDNLDTSEVTIFSNMFAGCDNLTTLDLSGMDLSSTNESAINMFGSGLTADDALYIWYTGVMIQQDPEGAAQAGVTQPLNATQFAELMFNSGETSSVEEALMMITSVDMIKDFYGMFLQTYLLPNGLITEDEMNAILALDNNSLVAECRALMEEKGIPALSQDAYYGQYISTEALPSIETVFAPKEMGSCELALPTEMSIVGTTEKVTSITSAQAGKTFTTSESPSDPTLPESGVELIDLIILTMLTLTISGVSLMLLKRKKVK